MKLPLLILIIGLLFCIYQFKIAKFEPINSRSYERIFIISHKEKNIYTLMLKSRHPYIIQLKCESTFKVGQQLKVRIKYDSNKVYRSGCKQIFNFL